MVVASNIVHGSYEAYDVGNCRTLRGSRTALGCFTSDDIRPSVSERRTGKEGSPGRLHCQQSSVASEPSLTSCAPAGTSLISFWRSMGIKMFFLAIMCFAAAFLAAARLVWKDAWPV